MATQAGGLFLRLFRLSKEIKCFLESTGFSASVSEVQSAMLEFDRILIAVPLETFAKFVDAFGVPPPSD
jgi:hypothetical protein